MKKPNKSFIEVDSSSGKTRAIDIPPEVRRADEELKRKARIARLETIEDELLDEAASVIRDVQRFADLDPATAKGPPKEWMEELGYDGAWKRYRLAMAGWAPSNAAPTGIKVAAATVAGVLKAKASRDNNEAPRFNVTVMLPSDEMEKYPELEVEK